MTLYNNVIDEKYSRKFSSIFVCERKYEKKKTKIKIDFNFLILSSQTFSPFSLFVSLEIMYDERKWNEKGFNPSTRIIFIPLSRCFRLSKNAYFQRFLVLDSFHYEYAFFFFVIFISFHFSEALEYFLSYFIFHDWIVFSPAFFFCACCNVMQSSIWIFQPFWRQ